MNVYLVVVLLYLGALGLGLMFTAGASIASGSREEEEQFQRAVRSSKRALVLASESALKEELA